MAGVGEQFAANRRRTKCCSEGLERNRSRGTTGRFTELVLVASLAAFLLWLLGTAAERCGLEQRMRPSSGQCRAYSRLFLARLLLVLESCRDLLNDLIPSVGLPERWVARLHDALVTD